MISCDVTDYSSRWAVYIGLDDLKGSKQSNIVDFKVNIGRKGSKIRNNTRSHESASILASIYWQNIEKYWKHVKKLYFKHMFRNKYSNFIISTNEINEFIKILILPFYYLPMLFSLFFDGQSLSVQSFFFLLHH